jgi:membrane-bound lytic murein transglycosylase F
MNRHLKILLFAVVALVFVLLYFILIPNYDSVDQIKKNGKLKVIMANNANVYYSYRDQYMGFEYDLVKKFADYLGIELEILTPGWDKMFEMLNSGEGDLIAAGMTITEPREEVVDFSDEYLDIQQQAIIHKKNRTIKKMSDMDGEKIHIRAETSYQQRLQELQGEGLDIDVVLHPNLPTEELIRQVAEGEIKISIADSNIALLNQRYYPDIRIAFPIEEPQSLGWAVRKGSNALLKEINAFFDEINENGTFGSIYERYYQNVTIFDYVDLKKFHKRLETRLPKYKSTIQREAKKHGFDWRMIAAVVYQESHFNPKARSYTGVRGLMQVTQGTAKEMGITNRMDPSQSLKAGVGYLAKLYNRFDKIEYSDERLLFALASYNVGYGHVRDAQNICREKGWDPHKWASLKKALPLLRVEKYYKNTKYGYARGTEPVRYTGRILTYFDIIKRKSHM